MVYTVLGCRFLIGAVFAFSAFSKLRTRKSYRIFASWLHGLPIFGTYAEAAAAVAVVVETTTVALLVPSATVTAGLLLGAGTLAVFAGGTWVLVSRGVHTPCRCFGNSAAPLGIEHIVRNVLLCAVAATGAAVVGRGGAAQPAGVAMSIGVAAAALMPVLFLDDLIALFSKPLSRHDQ